MNTNNILINNLNILPVFKRLKNKPKRWQGLFNFKNIEHNLMINTSFIMNGCAIKKRNSEYTCYPLNYKISLEKIKIIEDLDLETVNSLISLNSVIFNDLETLIFYVYLDIIIDFLEASDNKFIFLLKEKMLVFNKFYRSSILETNKYAIYLERNGNKCVFNKKIEKELIEIFINLKIKSLELPNDYDINKTIEALKEFKDIMDKIKLPIKARNFNLKFKKLGIYKDNGFYSKEKNTIIIDPRTTHVFIHELGHMIYDNQIKINKKVESLNSEDYAIKFVQFLR